MPTLYAGPAMTLDNMRALGDPAWLNRCRRLAKDFENLTRNALARERRETVCCKTLPGAKLFNVGFGV